MEGATVGELSDRELLLEIRGDLKEVKTEVRRTNGRVTALEDWRRKTELHQARADGEREGRESVGAIITRGQLAAMSAVMGVVGAAAGVIARFWP